ncbi:MAG: LamG domain-containing protein, partial [Chloroflexota bacterium]
MQRSPLFKAPSVVILLAGAVLLVAALVGGNWSGSGSDAREALAQGTLPTPTPKCAPLPSGLVHWWTFNETSGARCDDIIGSRNGIAIGGQIGGTGPASVTGMVNGALGFDGSSTFVEVPDSLGTLSFGNPTDNFTIDAWIKIDSADKSGVRSIVDKRVETGGGVQGYALILFNGLLFFQLGDGSAATLVCDSSPTPASSCTNYVSSVDVANGNWRSVAVTVQRTGVSPQVVLYVDGTAVYSAATRTGNATNNASLMIGRGYPIAISTPFFKGAIDEVEIFNRALTQSEVQSISDAFSAGKCTPTPTPTPTPTNTPTATPTNTPTPTPTITPTPTPTIT